MKNTRKSRKMHKLLAMVSCALLLVAISVGATVAYLTSTTEVVKNTFTVGNVNITLDEAKVDLYGVAVTEAARVTQNSYKLIPGHNYTKDPIVHVTAGSEKCWLFVKVVDEIAGIEAENTVAAQMTANNWAPVAGAEGVFAYGAIVDASDAKVDVPVFGSFTIKGDANVAAYDGKTITVQAYAVQADGFADAAAAWKAAPASWN